MRQQVTIVGGGIAGLAAAITCAEAGAPVRVLEAHDKLGGRARSTDGPYRANLGPHVLYKDGPLWRWLRDRKLPAYASVPLGGIRVRLGGELRRTPPLAAIPSVLRLRGREAPIEQDFRGWAERHTGAETAAMLSAAAGVYTFHHDPGELSAAFVWQRTVRTLLTPPPAARYAIGGWTSLVDALARRAGDLGVAVETGCRVDALPTSAPVIVATELPHARTLLGDESLRWQGGRTICIDLGLRHRRGDPFIVSDLDEAGWVERFTAPDPSLAPTGEELIQAQMPLRPKEGVEEAALRLERLLDLGLPDWRERETWRRRQLMDSRSGALDMPGVSWCDRPAIDRGEGVYLAGDMVAAPGLLSEVSWASALEASALALRAIGMDGAATSRRGQASFAAAR